MIGCRMHEVSVHCWEERVDDLFEIVVESSLSLAGIGADAILDEIEEEVDPIEVICRVSGSFQFCEGEGVF